MFTILAAGSYLLLQSLPTHAYYKKVTERVRFADANAKCNEVYGTDLASIHSNDDFDRALDTCGATGPCWLGGIHGSPATLEISQDFTTNNWQWMDGSEWNYENWGSHNGVPQGQGITGEYFTCLWEVWHQQNDAGVGDCGDSVNGLYPICNAPNPIKCEQSQSCTNQELVAENVYCTGYRACVNSQISAKRVFIQGIRAVEGTLTEITAENIYCFGQSGAPQALMISNGIEQMNAYFYGFQCGSNTHLHCSEGSLCKVFCDGKFGCAGLSISYDSESVIDMFPDDCQLEDNYDRIVNNIRCPKEIVHTQ